MKRVHKKPCILKISARVRKVAFRKSRKSDVLPLEGLNRSAQFGAKRGFTPEKLI